MSRDKGEATTDSRRDAIMLKSNLLPAVSDPQTEEQQYQRNSCTVASILDSTSDFTTWGSGKRTGNPQGI